MSLPNTERVSSPDVEVPPALPDIELEPGNSDNIAYAVQVPVPKSNSEVDRSIRSLAHSVLQANKSQLETSIRFVWLSYFTLYAMYVALFLVGVATAVAAIIRGFSATSGESIIPALLFAGMSVGSFFTLFISRPLESLERNNVYSSWLTAAMNTYWTQIIYLNSEDTVEQDLRQITADLIAELTALGDAYATAFGKYPPLVAPGQAPPTPPTPPSS